GAPQAVRTREAKAAVARWGSRRGPTPDRAYLPARLLLKTLAPRQFMMDISLCPRSLSRPRSGGAKRFPELPSAFVLFYRHAQREFSNDPPCQRHLSWRVPPWGRCTNQ